MREILFRGKGNPKYNDGSWHEGYLKYDGEDYQILDAEYGSCARTVLPETVGQFTGKTDLNGRKIFEGDIVENNWCFIHSPSVIRFGEYVQPFNDDIHTKHIGHIGFYVEHTGENKDIYRKDLGFYADRCEIIGNIHDNPELIGGE